MARTTQYVGLTARALLFVSGLEEVESDSVIEGMFGEPYRLRRWDCKKLRDLNCICIREKVQVVPWSSGAMVFTLLEIEYENKTRIDIYHWVADPLVKNGFDREHGAFWT